MYVCNITPWMTPHSNLLVTSFMLIKVFCVVSILSKLGGGGGWVGNRLAKERRGSNRLPGLVSKQQAVEFPRVLTSE